MTPSPTSGSEPAAETKPSPSAEPAAPARALATLAGLSFGVSAFLSFGFYDVTAWGPLALGALAIVFGAAVARPAVPSGPALAAMLGLLGLWVWSLLSIRWAESSGQALLDAERWLLYAAVLLALLLLLRGRGVERELMGGACAGALVIAGYLLATMVTGGGAGLFLTNRLNDPAQYVNATAAYLLIGLWPLIAVVEGARSPALRALALAGAVCLCGVALMTQSRGAFAALAASAAFLLFVVPGRVRRGWALAAVAAAVASTWPWVGDLAAELPPGAAAPGEDAIRSAALSVLTAAAVAGLAWLAVELANARLSARLAARARVAATAGLAALATAGALVAVYPPGERFDEIREQYEDFTELEAVDAGGPRFASGGGNRYDYWSVAVDQLGDHPVGGVGAGNFDTTYFLERESAEDVRQPHSIELQALGDTGLIGGGLLAAFVAGTLFAAWRRARDPGALGDRPLAVAAAGAFLYWLLHTSVDWLHLIPGLSAIALCAAAALLAPWMKALEIGHRRSAIVAFSALALAVFACAVSIAIPTRGQQLRDDSAAALATDPGRALARARDALEVDPGTLEGRYLEAAALARLGRAAEARATLIEATEREPSDYVTWVLLGDLALRRGDLDRALNAYVEASALNPRDPALAQLASGPDAVEQFAAERGVSR